jgi:hypothetical protein
VPVLEVVEDDEQRAGVGGGREGGRVPPAEGVGVANAGLGQQDVGGLAHGGVGAL